MTRIVWQSKSNSFVESFSAGTLSTRASGGAAYEFAAAAAMARSHDVSFDENAVRSPGMPLMTYVRRLRASTPDADVVIKQPFPIVFGRRLPGAQIGVVHHFDLAGAKSSPRFALFNAVLRRRLREMDAVVAVSQFWKDYLERNGCNNVHVIFNSFPTDEYQYSQEDVGNFLENYNIDSEKPIVYIGNASRSKGVYEVYEQLSDKDYTMIMTGRTNGAPDLPVRYFNLTQRDYHLLLKASSVVVTMSRMLEGWNRVAHEALLLGTPVVGSGAGGMRELLTNGGQIIAASVEELPQLVEQAINDRATLAEAGRRYAGQFDAGYWQRSWDNLLKTVMS